MARKTKPTTPESKPKAYMLRTCNADMTAHSGFVWPKSGPVECLDWDPSPQCGHGLHGLLWGGGNLSMLSNADDAVWQVVEIEEWVDIDQKIKVPRGVVVYTGDMGGATVDIAMRWLAHLKQTNAFTVDSQLAASGDHSKLAASGDYSKLAASGHYSQLAASGDSSQLAASGHYSKLAASGDSSQLAASGDSSQLAASGDYSKLAASGDSSQLAASGDYSKLAASGDYSIAMSSGPGSTASAGANGAIALTWWDSAAKRFRVVVGYVGEDGIEAHVIYRVEGGKLVSCGKGKTA